MLGFAWLVRDAIPNYLKSVPIPYGFADIREMTVAEIAHLTVFTGISTYIGFAAYQKFTEQPAPPKCNYTIQQSDEKVVHAFDIEDLAEKEVYWNG